MFDTAQYEGIAYVEGKDDCYGLMRRIYRAEYGLHLRNYARPVSAFWVGLDLLTKNFKHEGFELCESNTAMLQKGDALLIKMHPRCPGSNHVGMYVGDGKFIHHLADQPSSVDSLSDPRWRRRVMMTLRHPAVTEAVNANQPKINFMDFLPRHAKQRTQTQAVSTLDTGERAMRGGFVERGDFGASQYGGESST